MESHLTWEMPVGFITISLIDVVTKGVIYAPAPSQRGVFPLTAPDGLRGGRTINIPTLQVSKLRCRTIK